MQSVIQSVIHTYMQSARHACSQWIMAHHILHLFHRCLVELEIAPCKNNFPALVAYRFSLHFGSPNAGKANFIVICVHTAKLLVDERISLIAESKQETSEHLLMKFTRN